MNHVLFREATLVSSMADLVHDVIPQSANPQTTPEKIEWVSLQKCVNGEQMNCHKDDRQALINVPKRKLACEMKLIRLICF
ncbi:unnamed protein product [Gongylonema pulchrum]|uniref:Uncharacterized protein n=1 Tax=Gongylonema pulchrum TaxID=637853 RepID=A0A183F0M4_9BILA|nr:unnamed protein product [Gongylonema pulchrum]